MKSSIKNTVILLATVLLAGCSSFDKIKITSIKQKQIPTTIVLHPILATEINWVIHKSHKSPSQKERKRRAVESDNGTPKNGKPFTTSEKDESILISPPTSSTLLITGESQILSSTISSELALHGFKLKELPIDVLGSNKSINSEPSLKNNFGISIGLLNRLRENYNVQAIIVGNAQFVGHHYEESSLEKKVTFLHLKVIDIESLDIIAQISFPYDRKGANINLVAQKIALELANLAGITNKGMKQII